MAMKSRYLAVLLFCASCADNSQPAAPSSPRPTAPGFTTVTAITSSPGCRPSGTQIGQRHSAWVTLADSASSVRVVLYAGPPDPQQDQVGFEGSRAGDTITASLSDLSPVIFCGGRRLPAVGGSLTGTLEGNRFVGDFTVVFGTNIEQVTIAYHFVATV